MKRRPERKAPGGLTEIGVNQSVVKYQICIG